MAKKKSGSKKKKNSSQARPVTESQETELNSQDHVIGAESTVDVMDNGDAFENAADVKSKNPEDTDVTVADFFNVTKDEKQPDEVGNMTSNPADLSEIESESNVSVIRNDADTVKPADISDIDSEADASGLRTEDDAKKPVDISEIESEVDISDAKTEVVDNTAIEEDDDLATPIDASDHPDDEEEDSEEKKENDDVIVEITVVADTSFSCENAKEHPDDEPPEVIGDTVVSDHHGNFEKSENEQNINKDSHIIQEKKVAKENHLTEATCITTPEEKIEKATQLADDKHIPVVENSEKDEDRSIISKIEPMEYENQDPPVEEKVQKISVGISGIRLFSLAELMVPQDGVDWAKREDYLHEDEFRLHFGMDKSSFAKLAKWKQQAAKKQVGIF